MEGRWKDRTGQDRTGQAVADYLRLQPGLSAQLPDAELLKDLPELGVGELAARVQVSPGEQKILRKSLPLFLPTLL